MKNLYILTGPSGSGISSARFVFEELGFYIVENFPHELTNKLLNSLNEHKYNTNNFCLIVNIYDAKEIFDICKNNNDFKIKLVVLDTKKEEILKRYVLTRHGHPRAIVKKISFEEAIMKDQEDTEILTPYADIYINTTYMSVKEFRTALYDQLQGGTGKENTTITFMSFGLKNGIPVGLDCFFDVRTIPNPYWVDEFKELTGGDKPVIDYINSFSVTKKVISHITSYLNGHFEEITKASRGTYVVGIACSGGQHRSTYIANLLAEKYAKKFNTQVIHRDCPSLNKK